MQSFLLVGLGGGLGAMARYGVGVLIGRSWHVGFPLATLLVNILGSLLMGLFVGYLVKTTPDWQASARLFVAVGVLGGFTTFSTFSLDVISLLERGHIGSAILYAGVSFSVPVIALLGGLVFMRGV